MNPKTSPSNSSGSKFLVILLLAAVAGLGAWAFILKQDLATANEEAAAARKGSNGATVTQGEVQRLKAKVLELETMLAAVPASVPATATSAKPAPANPAASMGSIASQMMSNPTMRSMVASQMKRSLETRYADLFTKFAFSPEQRAQFIDILTENQDAMMDLSQKMVGGNLTPAEREEIQRQGKELDAGIEAKMRGFFNDETKYADYKLFNDQQTERTQVTALQTALARTSQPLTAEQSAAMADLMYQERKSLAATRSVAPESSDPAVALSSSATETRLREQEQLQARITDRAASVLNPDQLAALRSTQATQLQSLRLGAEMARQMLGNGQPAAK